MVYGFSSRREPSSMPILLFNLRNVPEDEADEIRALLQQHGVEFYETPANRWGISGGGIWLADEERLAQARELIDRYQRERPARVRGEPRPPFRPLRALLYLAIVGLILYLSIKPFLDLGR